MSITTDEIKSLRDQTGVSVMQCKKALEETGGDIEKAKMLLRKQSATAASKKGERNLGAGTIGVYAHNTKTVAAMVELCSETDFVSKNAEFETLARDIAMHVTATNPKYVSMKDISEEEKNRALEVFSKEVDPNKPEDIRKKILDGKLDAYFKENSLIDQPFIKNPEVTIGNMIELAVQKFGERIEIVRFARFGVLEE